MKNNRLAPAVSRVLAAAGCRPLPSGTPRSREGVRVTGRADGTAAVWVDLDSPNARRRRTDDIVELLTDAGYTVERIADAGIHVIYRRLETVTA